MENRHTSETMLLQVYGEYLMNGGTPDGFRHLTYDDIQVMFIASEATRNKQIRAIVDVIGRMFGGSR